MSKTTPLTLFVFIILAAISLTSARPTKSQALSRQKRQSDQRLAELETLLALQKYGRQRFRMDRKKGVGANGEHPPGYGLIDFRMVGRKKKSTRFSPGELENPLKQISISTEDRPSNFEENSYWTSDKNIVSDEKEYKDNITYSDDPPLQKLEKHLPTRDRIVDLNQPEVVPLFYLQNK